MNKYFCVLIFFGFIILASRLCAYADNAQLTGARLYEQHCASCHGARLEGGHDGPSLADAGGARIDFYLQTGRMPLAVPNLQAFHQPSQFSQDQIVALENYVTAHAQRRIPIPVVTLDRRLLVHGRQQYEEHCQACHGAAAQGATVGTQWIALPLKDATPRQIGEAIRIGPGVMPHFGQRELSDNDIAAIATYIASLTGEPQNAGGAVLGFIGPSAEGAVAIIIGLGSIVAFSYAIGTKAKLR